MADPVEDIVEDEVTDTSAELEMSDEDFAKLPEPEAAEPAPPSEETEVEEDITPETDEEITETEEEKTVTEGADTDEETAGETTELPEEKTVPEEKATTEEGDSEKTQTEQEAPKVDFEAEYKKLIAPFKANGSDMQVKNTDDAIRLMQMGANYHRKMAGLKPSLKALKLLENNDLLDPEKINFLIDLNNKNPEAITKLLRDSELDPMDINTKEESNYRPTQRAVTDTELALDSVLEEIRETPTYAKTLHVLTETWDDSSRKTIAAEPHVIPIINGHVADGTYDKIMSAVEYERNTGRLSGISDFDAYKRMGDALYAAGQLPGQNPPKQQETPVLKTPVNPPAETPTAAEIERKNRKKAASPTKTAGTPALKTYDPLSLSDEEFEKFDPKHFQMKT